MHANRFLILFYTFLTNSWRYYPLYRLVLNQRKPKRSRLGYSKAFVVFEFKPMEAKAPIFATEAIL
jgi:hypothetical protein